MYFPESAKMAFTKDLTAWHANTNNRSLPWKSEKDPYKIWLSEIILQQTRALQGLPYYLKFTEAYPTVKDLSAAKDEDVFRLWQGLGYYNRCKNMLATARIIAHEKGGIFPNNYEEILSLRGIGPYTAAAIASFAYGLPYAVVDGNVTRVLARYFGIETPFDTTEGKTLFAGLAADLLNKNNSAGYNQAIMDLGATICTPRNSRCSECPLEKHCVATGNGLLEILPVKQHKTKVRKRFFNFILLELQDMLWIEKRIQSDIWENLHQPYLIETNHPPEPEDLLNDPIFKNELIRNSELKYKGCTTQKLTHQLIEARFFSIELAGKPEMENGNGKWLNSDDLKKTAFPRTVISFLENNLYF
jgi:A/G-specific adenine glycosylase